jgi:hypothetical protein
VILELGRIADKALRVVIHIANSMALRPERSMTWDAQWERQASTKAKCRGCATNRKSMSALS